MLDLDNSWTVSQLTSYIREMFDIDFRLQDALVKGEISNYSRARSGHLYFTLKDERAQLRCVMWRSAAERLKFNPQDGDAVLASGRVSVYESSGVYQLYVESLGPVGRGQLAIAFEELKAYLAGQGLFDQQYKKPLAAFPKKIGIVTSADAAALRDILHVLKRRWPLVSVMIAPTLVQGKDAPPQIARALLWLDGRNDIDTIILARGGGSLEDLWAFNDEKVAQAIFAAKHPVITGIGHETDFTIADFVADLRAPTPSAAAELAVPDQEDIGDLLHNLGASLGQKTRLAISQRQAHLFGLTRTLNQLSPIARLDSSRQQLDWLVGRLDQSIGRKIELAKAALELAETALGTISPLATLSRGYAIVRRPDGQVVRSVTDVVHGDAVAVLVADGEFGVTVQ